VKGTCTGPPQPGRIDLGEEAEEGRQALLMGCASAGPLYGKTLQTVLAERPAG
jgi:hypothetical protein